MPSYADEYAARQAGQTRKYKGPVRITISRGDLVLGADGTARYEEMWEEEEAMETDLVDSVDEELCGTSQASSLHNSFPNLGGSLLVLDTNTLISSLPLLVNLFSECLSRNVAGLSRNTFRRSPLSLIIPHMVIVELDGLKSSARIATKPNATQLAAKAQMANRWILDSLRQQKSRTFSSHEDPDGQHTIPERAWALHVENSSHAEGRRASPEFWDISPDDEIVWFALKLQRETHLPVSFCSDDVNARIKAEAEGLVTLSMTDLVLDIEKTHHGEREHLLREGAVDLLDQWERQAPPAIPLHLPSTPHETACTEPANFAAMDEDEVTFTSPSIPCTDDNHHTTDLSSRSLPPRKAAHNPTNSNSALDRSLASSQWSMRR